MEDVFMRKIDVPCKQENKCMIVPSLTQVKSDRRVSALLHLGFVKNGCPFEGSDC